MDAALRPDGAWRGAAAQRRDHHRLGLGRGFRRRDVRGLAFRHVAPERRDLDGLVAELDVGEAEPPADDPAVAEELLDLARMRVRADVEVLWPASQNQVADAAADEIRDVAALLQAIEDPQRVRVDIPARNRMVFARNDNRFGHEG